MTRYETSLAQADTWARCAAEDWYRKQCRNVTAVFYCYHKPSVPGTPGGIIIDTAPPADGWELSDPTRISPSWSEPQAFNFLLDVVRRLPILPA